EHIRVDGDMLGPHSGEGAMRVRDLRSGGGEVPGAAVLVDVAGGRLAGGGLRLRLRRRRAGRGDGDGARLVRDEPRERGGPHRVAGGDGCPLGGPLAGEARAGPRYRGGLRLTPAGRWG